MSDALDTASETISAVTLSLLPNPADAMAVLFQVAAAIAVTTYGTERAAEIFDAVAAGFSSEIKSAFGAGAVLQ